MQKKGFEIGLLLASAILAATGAYASQIQDADVTVSVAKEQDIVEGSYEVTLANPKINIAGYDASAQMITADLQGEFMQAQQTDAQEIKDASTAAANNSTFMEVSLGTAGVSGDALSLFFGASFYTGGAHPYSGRYVYNYDMTTGARLPWQSVKNTDNPNVDSELLALLTESWNALDESDYFSDDQIASKAQYTLECFDKEIWNFSEEGLTVNLLAGEVEAYAAGPFSVTIPYEKLSGIVKSNYLPAGALSACDGVASVKTFSELSLSTYANIYGTSGSYAVIVDGAVRSLYIYETDMEHAGYVNGSCVYQAAKADGDDLFLIKGGATPYYYLTYDTVGADGARTGHIIYADTSSGTVRMCELANPADPLPWAGETENTQPETQAPLQPETQPQTQPETQPQAPPQPETQPQAPASTASEYIFPNVDTQLISESVVAQLTLQEICYAKNEVYARHGRKFVSVELQQYFMSRSWYQGTIEPAAFSASVFNSIENQNIELLARAENQRSNNNGYALDQPGYDISIVRTGF